MNLLIGLLILALIIYVVYLIVGMLPLPEPAKQIVMLILAVIFLIILLQKLGIFAAQGPIL